MSLPLNPSNIESDYTDKERIGYYAGVPVNDIKDFILEDADSWVNTKLKEKEIDPDSVDVTDDNLRMATTYYAVFLLSRAGGGKAFKINSMEHSSSSVGELSESLNSPQFTQEEKPTTDWYGLAQREIKTFFNNQLDSTKVGLNKWTAKSASTTDKVGTPFTTTGKEEYPHSPRFNRTRGYRRY